MAHVMIHQDVMDTCRPVFDKEADDGWLDPSSLKECLKAVSQDATDAELELVCKGRGEDHKSGISFNTFLLLAMQLTELRSHRMLREEDALAAFSTLVNVGKDAGGEDAKKAAAGQPTANLEESSVTSDQLKAVLADFELKVSVSDIVRDADLDGNGTLELEEFRAMIAETPDPKMLSGAFRIGAHKATTAEEPFYYGGSSPTKVKRQDNTERMKKSERVTKVNQDDNDETDETKIKKLRKNFNFMNSLHKQYKDKQSGPRSEASRLRTSKPNLQYKSPGSPDGSLKSKKMSADTSALSLGSLRL